MLKRHNLADVPRWAAVSPYCTVLNIGINNDGFTKEGITFPSRHAQLALEKQVWSLLHPPSEGKGKHCVWDQCVSRRRLLTNRRDTEKADCREQSTAQLYWNIANDDVSSWACPNPARICAGLPTGWSEPSRYLLCGSPRHRNSSWRRPGTGRHQQVVRSGRRAKGSSMDWLRQIKYGSLRRMLLLGK